MPDIEKADKAAAEAAPEEKKPKSKLPLMLIVIVIGAFIVTVGIFSFAMGVFSSKPEIKNATEAGKPVEATADTMAALEGDAADVAKLEEKIFGQPQLVETDTAGAAENTVAEKPSPDTSVTEPDPAQQADEEKARLAGQRAELVALKNDLDAQEKRLQKLLAQIETVESSRISALAKLYDGMDENQVAPLITQLTEEQAVQVLMKMKPANAAKILGAVSPEWAARISAKMITLTEE